jgi:hypothetical protein
MVDDGVSGMVTENSREAYTSALEKIVCDADLRKCLAEGAKERGEGYTVEAMAGKMERVYQTVTEIDSVKTYSASGNLSANQDHV